MPVNATAEVHLPAPAGARVLESGRGLGGREDARVRSRSAEVMVVAIGSGSYRFDVAR